MKIRFLLAGSLLVFTACTQSNFTGQNKKSETAPLTTPNTGDQNPKPKEDPNPDDPTAGKGTDCTGKTEAECVTKRDSENSTESFRKVDCTAADKAACEKLVKDAIKKDGNIENTHYIVQNCKDQATCSTIPKDFDGKDVVVTDASTDKTGDVNVDDGSIEGIRVLKVGVNFEDLWDRSDSDHDFNDAVLCFSGKFAVKSRTITSLVSQTVSATTSSLSGCHHNITAVVKNAAGNVTKTISYDSRRTEPLDLVFTKGGTLMVYMQPTVGGCTKTKVGMDNPQAAVVQPDVCNTTGK